MDVVRHDTESHVHMRAGTLDGFASLSLIITCVCMFVGAYAAGMLPHWFRATSSRFQTINTVGAGLLIGTALCVIVPEGFSAFSEAQEHGAEQHQHAAQWLPGLMLLMGFMGMLLLENLSHHLSGSGQQAGSKGSRSPPEGVSPSVTPKAVQTSSSGARTTAVLTAAGKASPDACAAASKGKADVILTTPVVECTPDFEDGGKLKQALHEQEHQQVVHLGCSHVHRHHHYGTVAPAAAAPAVHGAVDPARQAYIGLLTHSVADGLAVGAASLSTNLSVTFTVAAAMVLHKGPVAFGLTLYLQAASWDEDKRHKALLLFCATSPLAAVLTYVLLGRMVPGITSHMGVALCVLFSGGTFLYAACVHIFPSVLGSNGMVPNRQLPALLAGAVLPLFLSTLVPHHH